MTQTSAVSESTACICLASQAVAALHKHSAAVFRPPT